MRIGKTDEDLFVELLLIDVLVIRVKLSILEVEEVAVDNVL